MKPNRNPLFPTCSIRYQATRPLALAFAAVLTLGSQSALAALTWNSAGPSDLWSTAGANTNWNPGGVVWTQNESAVFDGTSGTPEAINVTTANTFDNITFDVSGFSLTSSGGGSLALANDLASTITVTNLADSATIAENLVNNAGGASALTKSGLGTLTLNGTSANTYSGGTTVSAGTLVSSQNTDIALLGTGTVSVGASGTVKLENASTTADTVVANAFTGSGIANIVSAIRGFNLSGNWSGFTGTFNVNTTAGGKLNFTGTPFPASALVNVTTGGGCFYSTGKTFINNFTAAGTGNSENRGAFRLDNGCLISGNITLTGNTTFGNSTAGTTSTISGIVSGTGFAPQTAATGGGIIAFSGLNDYTGKTLIAGQTIFSVATLNNSGNAGNLGKNSTIDFGATTTGGTLIYTGAGETTDRVINLAGTTGGAAITQSATSGLLKITSNLTSTGVGLKTLTLGGSSAGSGEISGTIGNIFTGGTNHATIASADFLAAATSITVDSVTGIAIGATVSGTGITGGQKVTSIAGTAAPFTIGLSAGTNAAGTLGQAINFTAPLSINKSGGTGTWTLSGNNSFNGGVNIATGDLVITNSNALGAGPKTVTVIPTSNPSSLPSLVLDGSAGDISLSSDLSFTTSYEGVVATEAAIINQAGNNTIAGSFSLTGGGGGTNLLSNAGKLTVSGNIINIYASGGRTLILRGAANGEVSGIIGGGINPISVTKDAGAGTWTLSGNNTYTGTTTVSTGTLVLSGTNATTGATAANGGTLKLDYTNPTFDTTKLPDGAVLTLGGGTVEIAGGTHSEKVLSTTLTAGKLSNITRTGGATGFLKLGTVTANTGSQLVLDANNIASTTNPNVGDILPWARVLVGGTPSLGVNSGVSDGDGGFLISAYGSYTDVNRLGGTIPNSVTNNVRIIEAGISGDITLAASPLTTACNFLEMSATGGPALVNPGSGDILMIGDESGGNVWQSATAGALTIGASANDGILTSGNMENATATLLSFINDSTTNPITVNSAIANNGTTTPDIVSIATSGAGQVVLAGDNTLTSGGITANAGSLLLSGSNNALTGAITANAGATVTLSGNNSGRAAGVGDRTVINNGGTLQLQANVANISSGISYALSAEQTAAQPLRLVGGGLLQLRSDSSLTFAGANNMGGLGSATVNIDVNNLTSGTGNTLTLAPAGFAVNTTTINVTGGNGYTLATGTISNSTGSNSATLTLNPTSASMSIGGYTGTTAFTSTLALGGTSAGNSVTGAITNTTHTTPAVVSLSKSGTSIWTLNGANTFTGNIAITGGTLAIGGSGNLTAGTYAGTIANAGILDFASSATQSLDGIISGAGTLKSSGTGSLRLTVANTYTGTTTITSGTVIAQNSTALGTAAAGTTISGSGTLDLSGTMAAGGFNLGTEVLTISGTGVGGNGVLVNNGSNDQINATGRIVLAGNATIGGTKRWDLRSSTPTMNMGGFTLTKTGANTVSLVGAAVSNPGNVIINTGIFSVETGTNLGGSAANTITVNNNSSLQFYANTVTIPWSVVLNGSTMSQINTSTTVSGGVTLGTGTNTISVTGTSLTLNGSIGGGGGFKKTGIGLLTVGGSTSYSGDTTVSAGTLKMNLASSFADTSAIRLTTGATLNLTIAGTDTVKELYIDNLKKLDGKWGRVGSIAALGADYETALITGDGLLQVSGSTYGDWIDTFFPGVTDPLIIGKTADPDKDGSNNLAEFGFDGDPSDGSINPKIFVFTTDTDADGDSDREVVMTAAIRIGAGAFTSAAPSTATSTADEITYTIQGSTTLGSFPTTVNAVPTAVITGLPTVSTGYSYRSFSLNGSNGLPSKGFLRAGVE